MKVESLWIVRDPTPTSELADICFELTPARLANYVTSLVLSAGTMGSSARETWERLGHVIWDGPDAEAEALSDALERLRPLHAGFPIQPPEDLR